MPYLMTTMKNSTLCLLGVIASLLMMVGLSQSALALQSDWTGDPEMAEARLIAAVVGTDDIDELPLGLEFRMAPGWKIYWRTPGEAGLAPTLDFTSSPNPVDASIDWPAPHRFDAFGFDNYGYETHVVLPLTVRGHFPGSFVQLSARLEALVCADICVPLEDTLTLNLPNGPATPSSHARMIAEYRAVVPRLPGDGGVSASGPSLHVRAASYTNDAVLLDLAPGAPPVDDIFVEGFDGVAFKAPFKDGLRLRIPYSASPGIEFSGGAARLTIIAAREMAEIPVTIVPDTSGAGGLIGTLSLWTVGIAFLGGLILNLMPCVLPVLGLKLASVLTAVGRSRHELRIGFLASAAGIVTSFLFLAGGLALVKMAGQTVGWGIQFQNPYFLGMMILLLGVFAASLLDIITFRVPDFVVAATATSSRDGRQGHLVKDFLAGMLATILATPCSAPFVGSAVTLALSGTMVDLFAIFVAMGLGLATPWLVVAFFPGFVGILPKPGPWMLWFKRGLALSLAATMVWLATVLFAILTNAPSGPAPGWQQWQQGQVAAHIDSGKVVLVDVTADWCITCKANKSLVLNQEPIASLLADATARGDLVLLQADWTRPNDEITAFLGRYGRYGIPFNIIYGPAVPDGIPLPELLSSTSVIEGLETAGLMPK